MDAMSFLAWPNFWPSKNKQEKEDEGRNKAPNHLRACYRVYVL